MPPELEHLSYSSISLYWLCARAWEFKYVKKVPTPTAPALAFGSAFHGSIEAVIKAKSAGEMPDLAALWSEEWAKATQQEISWESELPEEHSNLGLRMLTHKDTVSLLSAIEPMLNEDGSPVIEHRVELRVPEVPIPIVGYIDVMLANGSPADFKTAARMWTQEKAEEEMQPGFYLAALNQAGYTQNPEKAFTHFVFTKTRTPQAAAFRTIHTGAELLWLFGLIKAVWKGISAGIFPPNPGSWKCTPKYCDYWAQCRGRR